MVNLKVWIDDSVVYHSKTGQKATFSSKNELYEMPYQKKIEEENNDTMVF
jgi:hypothetical protein